MGKEKFSEKKHARLLYQYSTLSTEEIAKKVSEGSDPITGRTVRNWIKEYKWDKLKNFELEQLDVAKLYLQKIADLADKSDDEKGAADRASKYASIVKSLSTNILNTEDTLKVLSRMLDWVEIHKAIDDAKQIGNLIAEYASYVSDK